MCGFVGYIGERPPVTRERLDLMRDTLEHRGPDGAGTFVYRDSAIAVGLGHRRLSIIDTREVGAQPMHHAARGLTIAFNGEIYDFADLRSSLEKQGGHTFQTRTDTEVILHAYEAYGLDVLKTLDGMFAFALWDARERRLLLARDRLGKKPLYLGRTRDGALVFGSELKSLLASGGFDPSVDRQALFDYLALNYVPGPRTMLNGISKLPPAHALVWQQGETRQFRYWDQRFYSVSGAGQSPRRPSERQAVSLVRDELRSAVRRRLVSDVPIGMFLSGGIDSSAVLRYMAELQTSPVFAFTIRFPEASYDESKQAALVARKFGAHHVIEEVTPNADEFFEPLVNSLDEPFADSSAIPMWYLARAARRHVTVALGGDGGDEVFAGYRTHRAYRLANLYRRLPAPLREQLIPALVARLPVSHRKVSFDLQARQFVAAASETPARAHFGFKAFLTDAARRELLLASSALDDTARLFEQAFSAHAFDDALDGVLYCDFQLYLPDDILVKVDRMTMAHGLEARSPFLDHRLVEAVAALPSSFKLKGLRTKHLLKRALWGQVPLSILERSKAGFNVPISTWLSGPLRSLLRDTLSPSRVKAMGHFSVPLVGRMMDEHDTRQKDHGRSLWALLCFAAWHARFVEAPRP